MVGEEANGTRCVTDAVRRHLVTCAVVWSSRRPFAIFLSASSTFYSFPYLFALFHLKPQPELVGQTFPVAINVDLEHPIVQKIMAVAAQVYWRLEMGLKVLTLKNFCPLTKSNQRC